MKHEGLAEGQKAFVWPFRFFAGVGAFVQFAWRALAGARKPSA